MVMRMNFVIIYLIVINIVAVVVCIIDKIKAKLHAWRIPNGVLLSISLIGGALGMYTTMQFIRHKTKSEQYTVGLPIVIGIHAAIVYGLFKLIG